MKKKKKEKKSILSFAMRGEIADGFTWHKRESDMTHNCGKLYYHISKIDLEISPFFCFL